MAESNSVRVLVVDDTLADAFVIQKAVTLCLNAMGKLPEVEVAESRDDALLKIEAKSPDIVITDLFMEPEFHTNRKAQYAEMVYPRGLRLLEDLKKYPGMRRLATTFFWNYPGFSRFASAIGEAGADGALPKDLFYLVGVLHPDVVHSAAGNGEFVPLRILIQALHLLIEKKPPSTGLPIRNMQFMTLFAEAHSWLTVYANNVLEIRKEFQPKKKRARESEQEETGDILTRGISAPWMPEFVLRCTAAGEGAGPDSYEKLMKELLEGEWNIDLRLPSPFALIGEERFAHREPFDFGGKTHHPEFYRRIVDDVKIPNLLRSGRVDDLAYAQLIVTLGFFSYWCHVPDHRAARNKEEIARIITEESRVPYRGCMDGKNADKIAIDIECLNAMISRKIIEKQKRAWWVHLTNIKSESLQVVGQTKKAEGTGDKSGLRYWLDASLTLKN